MTARDPLSALSRRDEPVRRAVVKAIKNVAGNLADDALRRFAKELEGLLRRHVKHEVVAQDQVGEAGVAGAKGR